MKLSEVRRRTWVCLLPGLVGLACGENAVTTPGAGGSSSATTGNSAGGAGGGDEPCPQNPRAQCAVDCSGSQSDCGVEASSFDASGCARVVCMSDADCASDERCFGVGAGEPELCISMFSCMEDEEAGGCVCGGGADCYPGYCVPL